MIYAYCIYKTLCNRKYGYLHIIRTYLQCRTLHAKEMSSNNNNTNKQTNHERYLRAFSNENILFRIFRWIKSYKRTIQRMKGSRLNKYCSARLHENGWMLWFISYTMILYSKYFHSGTIRRNLILLNEQK